MLTSRPLELLDTLNTAGFARYDLRPTDRWLRRYLQQRGLELAELDQLTGAVPAIAELCRVPLFAAAAVDRYYQDAPPPATPLELALAYADSGLDVEEGRLLAPDPAAVRSWLERLALTMELDGVATVDRAIAASAGLERGLDLPEMQGLLDHLVERALLSEDGVEVGFHSGVVQEARAVKALLDAPGGLELLDGHVLVDVDEAGERGVRPSWGHSIELLAAAAPAAWRERIAAYDPLVVARTTPPAGSVAERSAASATIWAWYEQHQVWLPRDRPGQLLDDLRTIRLLSTNGITDELRNRLRDVTTGGDPVARGNAIAVLVAIDDVDAARAALGGLLADPDPVVRRRAAAAAWDLTSAEALPALRQQLAIESDDLTRRTLAQAIVAVTPDDQVTGLLATVPADQRPHVWMVLDHRWSPAEQLRRLADVQAGTGGVDEWTAEWLDELLRDRGTQDWGEAELHLLVRLLLTEQAYEVADHEVVRTLADRYPETVWAEGLQHAENLDDLISLHILARLDDDTVTRLTAATSNPAAPNAAAAYLAWRSQPPTPSPPPLRTPPPPPPARPTLVDLIDNDDLPRLFRGEPNPAELAGLDPPRRARLVTQLAAALDAWLATPEPPEETAWQAAPERLVPPATVWRMTWWAALDLPVDANAWTRLARQPLNAAGVGQWLRTRFDPAFADQLASELPGWPRAALEHLVTLLPDRWPSNLAVALAEACRMVAICTPVVQTNRRLFSQCSTNADIV